MKNLFICCILLLVTQILFAQNSKLNEDLLNACEIGNVEMVNKLLVSGADPNCKSEDGYYPLHLACKSVNSYEISKLLIKHGANVNQRSKGSRNSGLTPIYYAAWNADGLATLKLLIENNADYSKPIPPQYMFKGSNLLGFAASNLNGLEIARYLISLEVNVNEKNRYSTPLSVAIVNNNSIEMIKLLLENGANPNRKFKYNETPLLTAIYSNIIDVKPLENYSYYGRLLDDNEYDNYSEDEDYDEDYDEEFNVNINSTDKKNKYYYDLIKLLIEYGADVNAENTSGQTPLLLATLCENSIEIINLLIENGCDLKKVYKPYFYSPLHFAAMNTKSPRVVEFLLKAGLDPNQPMYTGYTPLHFAAANSNGLEIVKLLVEYGADPNAKIPNKDYFYAGFTPLHLAALNPEGSEIYSFLISKGADENIENADYELPEDITDWSYGTSPSKSDVILPETNDSIIISPSVTDSLLLSPQQKGEIDIVKPPDSIIITKPVPDSIILSPLHLASLSESGLDSVKLLIKNGADVNCRVSVNHALFGGYTPLHCAVINNNGYEICKYLIEHGANVNALDAKGYTPLHYACLYSSSPDMVRLLIDNKANIEQVSNNNLFETPLICAVKGTKPYEFVKLLIEAGAKLDYLENDSIKSPISLAVSMGLADVVQLLITNGVNPDCNYLNKPLLLIALNKDYFNIAEILISRWVNPNFSAINFNKLLNTAVAHKEALSIANWLLENKRNGIVIDTISSSTFKAALQGHAGLEMVKLLYRYSTDTVHLNRISGAILLLAILCDNDIEVIEYIINRGANVNYVNKNNESPLYLCIRDRKFNIAKILIAAGANVNQTTSDSIPIIDYAITNNYTEITDLLIANGATPNYKDSKLLFQVLSNGNEELAIRLIEMGADVKASDANKNTPLHMAVYFNLDLGLIEMIIKKGAEINATDYYNNTPLDLAVRNPESFPVVKLLLSYGALTSEQLVKKPNKKGSNSVNNENTDYISQILPLYSNNPDHPDWYPLHTATYENNIEIARLLIQNHTKINAKTKLKETPLHFAADNKDGFEMVKLLVDNGANVNAKISGKRNKEINTNYRNKITIYFSLLRDKFYVEKEESDYPKYTPLLISIANGDFESAKYLVKNGAKVNITIPFGDNDLEDFYGQTPLFVAILCNQVELVNLLIEKGADCNFQPSHNGADYSGLSPIHACVLANDYKLTEKVLDAHGDVNSISFASGLGYYGYSPLHMAIIKQVSLDIIKLLIQHGANINLPVNSPDIEDSGFTPLHLAAFTNNLDATVLLLQNNANPDALSATGLTPAQVAENSNNIEIVNLLNNKDYAVFYYYKNNNTDSVISLLKHSPSAAFLQNKDGNSIFHLAIQDDNQTMINFLLNHPEYLNIRNSAGQTLLIYAIFIGRHNIAISLINKGADINFPDNNGFTPYLLALNTRDESLINLLLQKNVNTENQIIPKLALNSLQDVVVLSAKFSNDGKLIFALCDDKTIKIIDAMNGSFIKSLNLHNNIIYNFCVSPDNKSLIEWSNESSSFIVWDILTSIQIFSQQNISYIDKIEYSSDGQFILLKTMDSITIADSKSFKFNKNAPLLSNDHNIIAVSSDFVKYAVLNDNKTISIVDLNSSKALSSFSVGKNSIREISFSHNGSFVAVLDDANTISVWQSASGKIINVRSFPSSQISNLFFSFDDASIIVTDLKSKIYNWNYLSDTFISQNNIKCDKIFSFFLGDNNNQLYLKQLNNSLIIADLNTDSVFNKIAISSDKHMYLPFNPMSGYIRRITNNSILNYYDINSGLLSKTFSFTNYNKQKITTAPDSDIIALHNLKNDQIEIWNLSTHSLQSKISSPITKPSIRLSDNANLIAEFNEMSLVIRDVKSGNIVKGFKIFNYSRSTALVDTTLGKTVVELPESSFDDFEISNITFSSDNSLLLIELDEALLVIISMKESCPSKVIYFDQFGCDGYWISPDNKYIAIANYSSIKLYDLNTLSVVNCFNGHNSYVLDVSFSQDGSKIVSSSYDNTVKIWNIHSGKALTFTGQNTPILYSRILPDTTKLISISFDNTIMYWDIPSQKQLASVLLLNDSLSAVITPAGYFDGSTEAINKLNLVQGLENIPIISFFKHFYRPKLLPRILNGEAIESSNIDFNKRRPVTEVHIINPDNEISRGAKYKYSCPKSHFKLKASFFDNGGGISEIRVLRNGKLIIADLLNYNDKGSQLIKEYNVELSQGVNTIVASAFNLDGTGSYDTIKVVFSGTITEVPNLYLISVGINDYLYNANNLFYAVNDANTFSSGIQSLAAPLFNKISVINIFNSDATKDNITKALNQVKLQAKPWDVFVFYYAGHGVAVDDNGTSTFYFLPHNVVDFFDYKTLPQVALSSNEFLSYSRDIKADKQVVIIDACNSGAAGNIFAYRSGLQEEQLIAVLAQSTGTHFLFASSSNQLAKEIPQFEHGLFTYAILNAMSGANGLFPFNQGLTINDICTYAGKKVPEFAAMYSNADKIQKPCFYNYGQDFPLLYPGKLPSLIPIEGPYSKYSIQELIELEKDESSKRNYLKANEIKIEIDKRSQE